jgi:hypothetical protein
LKCLSSGRLALRLAHPQSAGSDRLALVCQTSSLRVS